MRHSPVDWLLLFSLALIWGTAFGFVKLSLEGFEPLTVAAIRIFVAGLVLTALALIQGRTFPRSLRFWVYAALIGLFGNALPFFLISWGQQRVDSGLAGVLMAIMPLVTLLLAHLFIAGDRMTVAKAMGFVLGFVGVVVLIGPHALYDFGKGGLLIRQLAVLGGAVSYAVATIVTQRMPTMPIVVSSSSVLLLASLMIVPLALFFERPWQASPDVLALSSVLWLGLVPTALATMLYFRVVRRAGATFLSLINFQIPVVAALAGVLLLGESPEPRWFYALALILLGLGVSQKR